MTTIYVTKSTFEKNANDGITYHTSKQDLADHVHEVEKLGGHVQVFVCVPIKHEAYVERCGIELYDLPEKTA